MWNRKILEKVHPDNLYLDGRPAVWPDTPPVGCRYIVVGEAPGKTEVKNGQVFCGRSGKLLREMLEDAGILGVTHLTNVSLYRPTLDNEDKPPSAKVIKAERPRLLMEIAMLKPAAVIAAGSTAAEALLGNRPRLRGMVYDSYTVLGHTCILYVTHHPAYCLYEPDQYRDLVDDLKRARVLETPSRFPEDRIVYVGSSLGFDASVSTGMGGISTNAGGNDREIGFTGESIAIDCEATSKDPTTARILCVSVSDRHTTYIFEPSKLALLDRALSLYSGQVVGHNSSHDEILLKRNNVRVTFTDDTLLEHYARDERRGSHKLKALAPTIARVSTCADLIWPYTHTGGSESRGRGRIRPDANEDDDSSSPSTWESIPYAELTTYCAADAYCTARLHRAFQDDRDNRIDALYSFLLRARTAFVESSIHGVTVHMQHLQEEVKREESIVRDLLSRFPFNPKSHAQTLAYLRGQGVTAKSTDAKSLRHLAESVSISAGLSANLLFFREHNKLLTGFLRPLLKWTEYDGRTHPTYKIHGTSSGRTSCSDPNLQQVPDRLKHLFIASPGHTFVGWDYRVHEVRGIAYLSRDKALCKILENPQADPHQLIANMVGIERQEAKRALFAVAYGAGVGKLVRIGMDPKKAELAYKAIHDLFPALEAWRTSVLNAMYESGYVETPYGRRRHFHYIDRKTAPHQERVAINFGPQSLCGDIALESAITVYEELGLAPLIFVHDFNCVEVETEKAPTIMEAIQEIAGSILPNPYVRFIPDLYVNQSWGGMKDVELVEEEVRELSSETDD